MSKHDSKSVSTKWELLDSGKSLLRRFFPGEPWEDVRETILKGLEAKIEEMVPEIGFDDEGRREKLLEFLVERLIGLCAYTRERTRQDPDFRIDVESFNGCWKPVLLCQAYFLSESDSLLHVIIDDHWKEIERIADECKKANDATAGKPPVVLVEGELLGIVRQIFLSSRHAVDRETDETVSRSCVYNGSTPLVGWLETYLRFCLRYPREETKIRSSTNDEWIIDNLENPEESGQSILTRFEVDAYIRQIAPPLGELFKRLSKMDDRSKIRKKITPKKLVLIEEVLNGILDGKTMKAIAAECNIPINQMKKRREAAFRAVISYIKETDDIVAQWDKKEILNLLISIFVK